MALYCLGCGYSLAGLETPACPECGRSFNPADPKSFSASPRPGNKTWVIATIYVANFFFWAIILTPTSVGMTESFTLWERVCMGVGALAGPVALALILLNFVPPTWEGEAMVSLLLWTAWLPVVFLTRIRRFHYLAHCSAAFAWGLCGAVAQHVSDFYA